MIDEYLSKNGLWFFTFEFKDVGSHIEVFCRKHPSFNGQSRDPNKTHLFRSGRLCFVSGREPKTQARARELAKQWAEYFLDYRRTGIAQN